MKKFKYKMDKALFVKNFNKYEDKLEFIKK